MQRRRQKCLRFSFFLCMTRSFFRDTREKGGEAMRVYYHCDLCGRGVAQLELDAIDETKLGLDCLTAEERDDIISVDETGIMHIKTLCDRCVDTLGLDEVRTMRSSLYSRIQ
jgi:hypothetical protein